MINSISKLFGGDPKPQEQRLTDQQYFKQQQEEFYRQMNQTEPIKMAERAREA